MAYQNRSEFKYQYKQVTRCFFKDHYLWCPVLLFKREYKTVFIDLDLKNLRTLIFFKAIFWSSAIK